MTVADFNRRSAELHALANDGSKAAAYLLYSMNLLLRSKCPDSSLKGMSSVIVEIIHPPSGVVPWSADQWICHMIIRWSVMRACRSVITSLSILATIFWQQPKHCYYSQFIIHSLCVTACISSSVEFSRSSSSMYSRSFEIPLSVFHSWHCSSGKFYFGLPLQTRARAWLLDPYSLIKYPLS